MFFTHSFIMALGFSTDKGLPFHLVYKRVRNDS